MNMDKRYGGYRIGKVPEDAKRRERSRQKTPPRVDLRKFLTSVESQVGNSCVANAMAGAYEYLAKRELGDSEDMINEEPDEDSYTQGSNFKIVEAEYIETDQDLWKQTLAAGYPIAFALNTFRNFDDASRNKGRVPMPKADAKTRNTHGWHAMLCVGYSDIDRDFIVRNSWGREWGDKGDCYIPYDYVMGADRGIRRIGRRLFLRLRVGRRRRRRLHPVRRVLPAG